MSKTFDRQKHHFFIKCNWRCKMNIGARIKKYREKQNISQDELALKIFVTRQTISNWETSKSYPDIKSLTMLSNIFHVTLDDFIKEDIEEMKKIVSKDKIEKFNIMSYIFYEEVQQEIGKRNYQKILLAILTGLITFIIFIIEIFIIKKL